MARSLADVVRTLPRAYWEDRHRLAWPASPLVTGTLVAGILYTFLLVGVSLQPRIFRATARVRIASPAAPIPLPARADSTEPRWDPFQLQTERERLVSPDVIDSVLTDPTLRTRLETEFGTAVLSEPDLARQVVLRGIEIQQFRNTDMLEIRTYSRDASVGAEIANRVAAQYLLVRNQDASGGRPAQITDAAEPGLRPVGPNVPATVVVGGVVSAAAGMLAAGIVWLGVALRRKPSTAPRAPGAP